jgi:integrase
MPSSRAKVLQKLSAILDLARRDGAFKVNLATDVKPPEVVYERVGRALTDDELGAVLAAAESVRIDQAVIVWLMARGGLPVGEALALKRTDIDFGTSTVAVVRTMGRDGTPGSIEGSPSRGRRASCADAARPRAPAPGSH